MNSLTKTLSELQNSKAEMALADSQRCGLASNKNPILSCDCRNSKMDFNYIMESCFNLIKVGQCLLSKYRFQNVWSSNYGLKGSRKKCSTGMWELCRVLAGYLEANAEINYDWPYPFDWREKSATCNVWPYFPYLVFNKAGVESQLIFISGVRPDKPRKGFFEASPGKLTAWGFASRHLPFATLGSRLSIWVWTSKIWKGQTSGQLVPPTHKDTVKHMEQWRASVF